MIYRLLKQNFCAVSRAGSVSARSNRRSAQFHALASVSALLLIGLSGCAPGGVHAPSQKIESSNNESNDAFATEPIPLFASETWETIYLNGAKLGYVHTVREPFTEEGRQLWRTTIAHRLETPRYNEVAVQESRVESVETESGELIRYETESRLGAAPVKSSGEVVGDQLRMTTTIGDKQRDSHMPWDAAHDRGFDAVTKSALRQPLAPGERRTLRAMTTGLDQPMLATFDLTARDWEEVDVGGAKQRLLRVDLKQTLPGAAPLPSVTWLNEQGESLKMELIPGMFAVRTTKDVALAAVDPATSPKVDIGFDTVVRLDAPAGDLHRARRVSYLVTLPDGEPATLFPSGPSQQVSATETPHTASIVVSAIRADDVFSSADPAPTDAERLSNLLVQSDDPLIKALAAEAVGDAATDVEKAAAIERFVHGFIQQASFSQAFATATDVAKSRQGDCTEYSVLTAALARAAGIPARVAVGLVYTHSAGNPGFAFHMWNELYVDGRWIPYDATLGLGGLGGGHLKLSDTHLSDGAALASFLPVVQVMGRLQIEVAKVE
jgi:hypothetical protein